MQVTPPSSRSHSFGSAGGGGSTAVVIELACPLKRGDGLVFDQGDPSQDEEGELTYAMACCAQSAPSQAIFRGPNVATRGRKVSEGGLCVNRRAHVHGRQACMQLVLACAAQRPGE
jgi:hypothetical protein